MLNKFNKNSDIFLFYFKYKDTPLYTFAVSILLLAISVLLIVKGIIPQFQNWFSINQEVSQVQERINTLEKNQSFLLNLDKNQLNHNFDTVVNALPFEKDYAGVLNVINAAAVSSGVVLDDYSFQVGNLSTKSAQLNNEKGISVELNIKCSIDSLEDFLKKLNQMLPLSEVVDVDYGVSSAKIGLVFYYKILPKDIKITYSQPLKPLTIENSNLLSTLQKWQKATQNIDYVGQTKESTPSADTMFTF